MRAAPRDRRALYGAILLFFFYRAPLPSLILCWSLTRGFTGMRYAISFAAARLPRFLCLRHAAAAATTRCFRRYAYYAMLPYAYADKRQIITLLLFTLSIVCLPLHTRLPHMLPALTICFAMRRRRLITPPRYCHMIPRRRVARFLCCRCFLPRDDAADTFAVSRLYTERSLLPVLYAAALR